MRHGELISAPTLLRKNQYIPAIICRSGVISGISGRKVFLGLFLLAKSWFFQLKPMLKN